MTSCLDIYNYINEIAPFETQEEWDNSGFLIGDKQKCVKKVLVCLDPTNKTAEKCKEIGADLMITHHPIIWEPLKSVTSENVVFPLIKNDIAVICAHTNWDEAKGGVCETLCHDIGLNNVEKCDISSLRIGKINSQTVEEFSKHISNSLNTNIRTSIPNGNVSKVAVCPGSGASLLSEVVLTGADTFVTGDAKHNDFIDFEDAGINLIACGHYETENRGIRALYEILKNQFPLVDFYFYDSPVAEYFNR